MVTEYTECDTNKAAVYECKHPSNLITHIYTTISIINQLNNEVKAMMFCINFP